MGARDISILPSRTGKMDEPLTESEQFTLRTELCELMRISRIARPGALRAASASARTFATIGESIINPIDFDEVPDVNTARVIGLESYSHMPGLWDFDRNFKKEAGRVNSPMEVKGRQVGNPFQGPKFIIYAKGD